MKKELGTKYDIQIEKDKYKYWLDNDCFRAGKDLSRPPFTVVIPPPNVTGKLHLGHAWDTTLQDIIVRRKRMMGFDTLWLPGMDHAGIATQAKVDEKLKQQGVSRYDLGREKFLDVAWEWKHEYAEFIRSQWAALGLSLDYSRERFTLDEGLNKAVNHVFVTLYNKGLLYQGERIINWDCQAKTALSNIEVEYKEIEGAFYHFNYPFVDGTGYVTIATTRPETMFADQAIMVHPEDERYLDLIGKEVYIPGTDVKIPVIADSYVEKDFGTGCVKVTPAHDPNDFEVGKRHNLLMPLCMNDDGTMNHMALKYEGLDRFECRKQLVKDLEELGLFVKKETMIHSVGHSERTGVVVEPRLSKQWFVKMEVLAEQVLNNNEYRFVPERFTQTLEHWLTNIQDWCVSRQLWWGHRIPAWYKDDQIKVQAECPGEGWVQDEDVLDTWFSSALWPFSTLGWPEKTPDFDRYYPTSLLVTGYDIIFFWVARMLFQGVEFTGHAPFNDILIHGLIRDSQGRKMSKSLGNGVDPFDIIDKYGTDSLRYFLTTNSAPGQDLRFDEEKIESSWNFINKLWNISRFVLMNMGDFKYEDINLDGNLNLSQKYILQKLNEVISIADEYYEKYEFGEVSRHLYNFIWDEFASWYVELAKVDLKSEDINTVNNTKSVLLYVLDAVLKLMHPFIPFVTEELHSGYKDSPIMVEAWPQVRNTYESIEAFDTIKDIIVSNRNIRNEMNKPLSQKLTMTLSFDNNDLRTIVENNQAYLQKFCNPEQLIFTNENTFEQKMVSKICTNVSVYFPLDELVNKEEEIIRLNNEIKKLEGEITRCERMLGNENFVKKASPQKVEEERNKLENYKKLYQLNKEKLEELK